MPITSGKERSTLNSPGHIYIYIYINVYKRIYICVCLCKLCTYIRMYEGKSLNNRNFIITFSQEYLQKLFVSYFST